MIKKIFFFKKDTLVPDLHRFPFIVVLPQRTQVTNIYLGLHCAAGDELSLQTNVNKGSVQILQILSQFVKDSEP